MNATLGEPERFKLVTNNTVILKGVCYNELFSQMWDSILCAVPLLSFYLALSRKRISPSET